METWDEIAQSNRVATVQLLGYGQWRSVLSRAYYAIYAEVTRTLLTIPVAMPDGRDGPGHKALPILVANNLTAMSVQKRWRLSSLIRKLYTMRCMADYRCSVIIGKNEAMIGVSLMNQAFTLLESVS